MLKNKNFYLTLFIVFLGLFLFTSLNYWQFNKKQKSIAFIRGKIKKDEIKAIINSTLDTIIFETNSFAQLISEKNFSKTELESLIQRKTKEFDFCTGLTVAFEPKNRNGKKELYAPFYSSLTNAIQYIENFYDYTQDSLETARWYTEAIQSNEGNWSRPYNGMVVDELVVDYGVPFYKRDSAGNNQKAGVVSFTISSAFLNNYLKKISLGRSGFAFIVNDSLELICHPSTALLTDEEKRKAYFSSNPEFLTMLENEEGSLISYSVIAKEDSSFFYSRVQNNWILVVVLPNQELTNYSREGNDKLILTSIFLSLSIIIFLLIFYKIWLGNTQSLWRFSNFTALILFGNIVFVWIIFISHDENTSFHEDSKVLGETGIINYLNKKNNDLSQLNTNQSFKEIPTGIFLYDIDFKNAYDVSIQGKIWQKVPEGLENISETHFVFPQASATGISVRIRPTLKKQMEDYWLYRYDFNATLQFDFDYLKYPLNSKKLDLQLMYPNMDELVILTPDLEAYDFTDPFLKPGISDDIYMPDSKIFSSFFTFNEHNFRSNLGNSEFNGLRETSVLTFNVLVKNVIISSIITYVIPIFIVAMLIFLLPFTVNQKEGNLKEGSALNIIQAAGGFFFVLLLSHIQLRSNIETPGLTYLETFYFVMYFMLVIMSSAVLLYLKTDKYPILEYKENLIFKLSYWPILLFSIYLISLFLFY